MSLLRPSLHDGDRLEVAGALVRLKVNGRARRVSLRLDRTRREIVATAPSARRLAEAAAFARDRAGWITARLAELPVATHLGPGELIEVFGQPVRLDTAAGRARWIEPEDGSTPRICAMGDGEGYARAVMLVGRATAGIGTHGTGLRQARMPVEKFRTGGYFRVVVEDAAGRRAWSNPVWLDSLAAATP